MILIYNHWKFYRISSWYLLFLIRILKFQNNTLHSGSRFYSRVPVSSFNLKTCFPSWGTFLHYFFGLFPPTPPSFCVLCFSRTWISESTANYEQETGTTTTQMPSLCSMTSQPGLEDLLPGWGARGWELAHTASKMMLPSWFPIPRAAQVSSWPGSWLPWQWGIQETKAEAAISFWPALRSPTLPFLQSGCPGKSAHIRCGKRWHEAWLHRGKNPCRPSGRWLPHDILVLTDRLNFLRLVLL